MTYDWPHTRAAWKRLKRAWRDYRIARLKLALQKAVVREPKE